MSPSRSSPPALPRRRRVLACWPLLISVAGSLGCTVYDRSLLDGDSTMSMVGKGGSQSMTAGAGGTPASSGAGSSGASVESDGGAAGDVQGLAGDSSLAGGGTSSGGNSSGAAAGFGGGNGGSSASAGSANGGTAGNGGSAGSPVKELAFGKSVTASTEEVANAASKGNDADTASRWCATSGAYPQWWRVDLGAAHVLKQVSIRFEHPERTYMYLIESSLNDQVYIQQGAISGTGVLQTLDFQPNTSARYLRVTVTGAVPPSVNGNGTWASFWELSLTGI